MKGAFRVALVVCALALPFLLRQTPTLRELSFRAARVEALCDSTSCQQCSAHCAEYGSVSEQLHACERSLPLTASVWPWDAYMQCVAHHCVEHFFDHACGLLSVHNHSNVLAALTAETSKVQHRIQQLRQQTHSAFQSMNINHTMQQYHHQSLHYIQKCDKLFIDALAIRAQYSQLAEYIQSLEYRIIQQEVTRLNFENEDFNRHLDFWKRHNQTLHLVVSTSPEAVKDARDALYSEMTHYETDALLIKALRNGSYTKERQARFTMRLREKVRKQVDELRERNAMMKREAEFIRDARSELYNLLHSVWRSMSLHRLNVTCGANVLSDAVTLAFKAESQLL